MTTQGVPRFPWYAFRMTFDDFLRNACPPHDLEWRKYRRRSARHRVAERIRELRLETWLDYLEFLLRDPEESSRFPDLMRVTMTRFFRERECWEDLADLLPTLAGHDRKSLTAWSAGCCGGEEPYSLAILWIDRIAHCYPSSTLDILATDIDDESLARGASARYSIQSLREARRELHAGWFERDDGFYRPLPEARRLVRFWKHNLMLDPPPRGVDLLLCRYLPFTYYSDRRLDAAVAILASALRHGGLLMIGRKEGMPERGLTLFAPVGKTGTIWRRE
jgi:chemotaxis protein methyltransferase CheR